MWLIPLVAIFVIGCFLGRARSPDFYKILALVVITFVYAVWQYYQMGDVDLTRPLSPATADFAGRVVVFFIIGVGGGAITNAIRLSEMKPRG